MRHPLLPITAALAAGILAAPHFYLSASEQVFFLTVMVLGAALLLRIGRCLHGMILCLLGFFLCGTFLAAEEHWVLPPERIESLVRRGSIDPAQLSHIVGWARTPSVSRPNGEYFDFAASEIEQKGRRLHIQDAIRVYYFPSLFRPGPSSLRVSYGERLSLSLANLRRPRNFLNPEAFDYEAYMRRQGIAFTGSVRANRAAELPGRAGSRWGAAINLLRSYFLRYLDQRFPGGFGQPSPGAILKAVLLGDSGDLDLVTESDFQASGTYHVLVVSGLNVTALAAGLLWLFALLRVPKLWSTLVTACAAAGYAAVTGSGTPVVRAMLMVLIYLAARLVYRERALLNAIAAAALIFLVLRPSDLQDPSFQLSFLAVLVLASVAVPMIGWSLSPYRQALRDLDNRDKDKHLEPRQAQFRHDARALLDCLCDPSKPARWHRRWLRCGLRRTASGGLALLEAVVFTVVMQVGMAPVMALYFHRVTWSGILANLLVIPLTSGITIAGLLVLAVALVWWSAAMLAGGLLGWLVIALQWVARWTGSLPRLSLRVPTPPLWLTISFLVLLVSLAFLLEWRSRWCWLPGVGLLVLCVALTLAPYHPLISPGALEVTAMDVGQGDALFVAFPGGKTMLVDAGKGPDWNDAFQPAGLDLGESVVSTYLWSRRIKTLDFVVATHGHEDHIGGLESVLKNFPAGQVWIGSGEENEKMAELLRFVSDKNFLVRRLSGGYRLAIDGVETQVLWPAADREPTKNANNDSVVLRLGYGRRHVLLPGDAETTVERRLLKAGVALQSDVLKVPHHGSNDATSLPFLEAVAPSFGILSVGPYNAYGHPRPETLANLRQAGARITRTDRDGATSVRTDGNRIEVGTFRETLRDWPPFPPVSSGGSGGGKR